MGPNRLCVISGAVAVSLLMPSCPGPKARRAAVEPGCGSRVESSPSTSTYTAFNVGHQPPLFVRDESTGGTVSLNPLASVSGDGRLVGFVLEGKHAFLVDLKSGDEVPVSVTPTGDYSRQDLDITADSLLRSSVAAGGRFVAFSHQASDLVPDDTNRTIDVFVRDLEKRTTTRVSVSSRGSQAREESWATASAISADGALVVFESHSSDLVPNDTNGVSDIFLHDTRSGSTERISVSSDEKQATPSSSQTGSTNASISADGRFVVYESAASNLVPGDTNNATDVFLRDLQKGTTQRISVGSSGEQGMDGGLLAGGAPISADGRCVVFLSYSLNLVSGDANRMTDVFVRDLSTGRTSRVSLAPSGEELKSHSESAAIFPDGRKVAFASNKTAYVRDLRTGTTTVVLPPGASPRVEPRPTCPTSTVEQPPLKMPNGRSAAVVAYAREGPEGRSIWLYDVASNKRFRVFGPTRKMTFASIGTLLDLPRFRRHDALTFSVSGGRAGHLLCELNLRTGIVRELVASDAIRDYDWSPDGKTMAYLDTAGPFRQGRFVLADDRGTLRARVVLTRAWGGNGHGASDLESRVIWSRDGRYVLASSTSLHRDGMLAVFSKDGRRLLQRTNATLARWSADSTRIYFREKNGRKRWRAMRVPSGSISTLPMMRGTAGISVSYDGRYIAHEETQDDGALRLYDIRARVDRRVINAFGSPLWLAPGLLAVLPLQPCTNGCGDEAVPREESFYRMSTAGGRPLRLELQFARQFDVLI